MPDSKKKLHFRRFKARVLRSGLRVLISSMLLGVLLSAGCEEKIFNNTGPEQVRVQLSPRLASPLLRSIVSTYQLTISADDMETIVVPLVWADGFVVGVVENIPAGPDRSFTLECFDENLELIYRGVTIAAVEAGQTVDIGIDLLPIPPLIRISPPFARLSGAGDSNPFVNLTIKIDNTPDITSLNFVVTYDPGVLVLLSVSPDSGLAAGVQSSFETNLSSGEIFSSFSASSGAVVDSSGHEELAVIRFQQRRSQALPDSTLVQIHSVRALIVDSLTPGIFTDLAVIELTPPTDTGLTLPSPPQMPIGFIEQDDDSTGQRGIPNFNLAWAAPEGDTSVVGYHVYKRINGGQFNRVTIAPLDSTFQNIPTLFGYIEPGFDTLSTDFLQYFVTSVTSANVESAPSDTVSFVPERQWAADQRLGTLLSPQDCSFTPETPGFTWAADPNAVSYIVLLSLENQGPGDGRELWIRRQSATTLTLGQTDGFTYLPLSQSRLTPDSLYRIEVISVDTGNALAGYIESRFWPVGAGGFSGITETDSRGVKIGAIDTQDWCEAGINGRALSPAFPNPTSTGAFIQFTAPASEPVEIFIYGAVGGPAIAKPGIQLLSGGGSGTVFWDLTDFSGLRVSKGIYRCVMTNREFCCFGDIAVLDTPIITNQPPVINPIGPFTVLEGDSLFFEIGASDPDFDPVSFRAENLPSLNATFVDVQDNLGRFSFRPNFNQGTATYFPVFIASDGALEDTEIVEITVVDVNRAPVWDPFPDTSLLEGDSRRFRLTAVDPEGDDRSLVLSALNVPPKGRFTDLDLGEGEFLFSPDFTQSGVYPVTFVASDGQDSSSITVRFTVRDTNYVPTWTPRNDFTIPEGGNINTNLFANDPNPAESLILTAFNLPLNATFVQNLPRIGKFDFSPDFTQAGVYPISFVVSDGQFADTMVITVTVTDSNLAPVLNPIGPQSVTEFGFLTFSVVGSDPDGTQLTYLASPLPTNSSFLQDDAPGYIFEFSPDATQAGVYNVLFTVSDGALEDSELVTITVTDTVLTGDTGVPDTVTIASAIVVPGASFPLAMRLFNDEPIFSATLGFSFVPFPLFLDSISYVGGRLDGVPGLFTERPPFIDNESGFGRVGFSFDGGGPVPPGDGLLATLWFSVSQSALSGVTTIDSSSVIVDQFGQHFFGLEDSAFIQFTPEFIPSVVTIRLNTPPTIGVIPAQQVNEGESLVFPVSASDSDSVPVLSAVGLPTNASFVDSGNGNGSFSFTPDLTQAGVYTVTFIASDGILADSEVVVITVLNTNQPPEFLVPFPDSVLVLTVAEGGTLQKLIDGSDPESDPIVYDVLNLPPNASFRDFGEDYVIIDFTPDFTQAGQYPILVIASDGQASDTLDVLLVVTDVNQAPVITPIGPQTVAAGVLVNLTISAVDPDSQAVALFASGLLFNSSFKDNGDGTGLFAFSPLESQVGAHLITFTASDGSLSDTEVVVFTVTSADVGAPDTVFAGSVTAAPGEVFPLSIRVFNDEPLLAATLGFSWGTPDINVDSVSYAGSRILADANRGTRLSLDNEIGAALTGFFNPGTPLLPAGDGLWATLWFTASPNASNQIIAVDSAFIAPNNEFVLIDSIGVRFTPQFVAGSITITANTPPTIGAIGPQQVDENTTLSLTVTASDSESIPALTTVGLPLNSSFIDNGNGIGSFSFTPDFDQAGAYQVSFIASDGSLADSITVNISVNNVNRAPSVTTVLPQTAFVGEQLNVSVTATDPDGDKVLISVVNPPPGATFVDVGGGVGVLTFSPDNTQVQVFNTQFSYTDATDTVLQGVEIAVTERCGLTLSADFSLDLINTAPDELLPGAPAKDGLRLFDFTGGGEILVRDSVGTLTNKPCELVDFLGTPDISMRANLAQDQVCSYQEVSWESLVIGENNKFSRITLYADPPEPIIASLDYRANGLLLFNGTVLNVTYTPGVAQSFKIAINYTSQTVSLTIDGKPVVVAAPYQNLSAANLKLFYLFIRARRFGPTTTSLVIDNIRVEGGGGGF